MENWQYKSYAYCAKRKNKLFLNILIEDINSKNEHFGHNFILNSITMTESDFIINYSMFNNDRNIDVVLTDTQIQLIRDNAVKIYKEYFK